MKKTLLILLATAGSIIPSFAAVQTANCATIGDTTGCDSCFTETSKLYACNPSQSSCQNQQIGGMYDIVHNTGNTTLVMYDDDKGSINFTKLQAATTWSYQDTVSNMFEATPEYYTVASASGQPGYQLFTGSNRWGHLMNPSTSLKWTQMKTAGWLRAESVTQGASRTLPAFRVAYTPRLYSNASTYIDHRQCLFYYVRFCGDGTIDADRGEQCDDGNMTSGDGCSNTCTTETPALSCNNLTLAPATLTKDGGNITATCSATNATQYKFVLKQGATVIQTKAYQTSNQTTFNLPANTTTSGKNYTVDCYVKNATQEDITSQNCNKGITVPGTVVEPAVCNSLTLSHTTIETNVPVNYICNATNATSYIIKRGSSVIGTLPEGTITFPTAGTYNIGCFINGQTDTPVACAKSITVTNPPIITNPSIFIDKDDSTPGTPDTDGNDIQRVQSNGTATFTIRVLNNGDEALKTVSIEDSLAPDCARTANQTTSLYAGGATANFDVGESFTYQCTRNTVTSTTFPNNRNTATVKGVGVTSSTNVTDSDVTEIFMKQVNPDITIEKDDTDNLDDEQEIDEGDTAKFSVKVTNNGSEALDNVTITDDLSPDCDRDESETRALIREIGNDDALFDPGETFAYTCRETSVDADTFPDEINTVCTEATGVDTDGEVDDCDDTTIIVNEEEEELMCMGIDSSKGTFGGAPFRTTITCEVIDYDSCEIEVMKDGEVIDTYDACSQNITFSETGNYSVACIVDDERTSDCEMDITVEAMTDVPTGTKILILAFLSLIATAFGTHLYKRKAR